MIIEPRIRGFICMTAHPGGCAAHVAEQIDYVQRQPAVDGPRRVLVIGASTGYGLASRIVAAFGCGADTAGVFFERPASRRRTASAGWYNSAAFERAALAAGRGAWSINGDAFSNEIREQTVELVARQLGQVDLVVYSLASPRRIHPDSGETFNSVLKPIGAPYTGTTIDPASGEVTTLTIDPADDAEIAATVAVMGGDDWRRWLNALHAAGLLAPGCLNLGYTYAGPSYTHAIYRAGTIGRAKQHLERTALELDDELPVRSVVSVNKALVTQASAAIPVIPLYLMLLFRVMKEHGSHEGAIEQIYRLFASRLYTGAAIPTDAEGRVRIDDGELDPDVQQKVEQRFAAFAGGGGADRVAELADLEGYRSDFLRLFGFGLPGVDYAAEADAEVAIPSLPPAAG
jgi:enoyl-[acyl-carrier protein] reductase/trans-2-enoyl-CoA reductase (NAD+)